MPDSPHHRILQIILSVYWRILLLCGGILLLAVAISIILFRLYWIRVLKGALEAVEWATSTSIWALIIGFCASILWRILKRLWEGAPLTILQRQIIAGLRKSFLACFVIALGCLVIVGFYMLLIAPPLLSNKQAADLKAAQDEIRNLQARLERDRPYLSITAAKLVTFSTTNVACDFTFRNRTTRHRVSSIMYIILVHRLDFSEQSICITNEFSQDMDSWNMKFRQIPISDPFFVLHFMKYQDELTMKEYSQNFLTIWYGNTNTPSELEIPARGRAAPIKAFLKKHTPELLLD